MHYHYPCRCRRRPVSSPRFHWRPPDDYRPTNITTYSTWNEAHSRGPMVGADNDTARNTGGKDRRSAVGRDEEEWAATTTRRMPTVVALKDPAPSLYWGSLKSGSKSQLK
ncbi:hypothetical protein TNCV_907851 [Trichonephila clavipes]|nr:hypothetical protein TNCV_907851 [Trichonephila clavipes]